MSKYIYILDPGHGGINPFTGQYVTPGKRSPQWSDGSILYEGVSNRRIAGLVGKQLKALNIAFCYTVTPSDWLDIPLTTRVQRANAVHSKTPGVLISIHSNAHSDPSANGYEVYTSPGATQSDKYAAMWYEEFAREFPELKGRANFADGDPDKEEKFTVISATHCPAFLIESMFYTNENECKMLLNPEVETRIASTIVRTIQRIEK